MKKYEIPLQIVKKNPTREGLVLSKMLLDCMGEKELYDDVSEKEVYDRGWNLPEGEFFEILGMESEERLSQLNLEDAEKLRNYDLALSLAISGDIDEAKGVMNYLKNIGAKKPLDRLDFEEYDEIKDRYERSIELIDEAIYEKLKADNTLKSRKLRKEILKKIMDKNEGY